MAKSYETRVEVLEHARKGSAGGFFPALPNLSRQPLSREGAGGDFANALREARRRAVAGDCEPQTPITAEMMEDPVAGEFYRLLFKARERVRLMRGQGCSNEQRTDGKASYG